MTGVEAIMRYTLRLLTAQQFQRASALIVALDLIRTNNSDVIHGERISIGLWVGASLSPNKRDNASELVRKMAAEEEDSYSFVVTKCPCCGAEIGITKYKKLVGLKVNEEKGEPFFLCENKKCEFAGKELPIMVVDDVLYRS
ncbi:MAG: helicase, partial [Bacteroidetes bacterium]|nr:helicase [Bacteroidota bacterium]